MQLSLDKINLYDHWHLKRNDNDFTLVNYKLLF